MTATTPVRRPFADYATPRMGAFTAAAAIAVATAGGDDGFVLCPWRRCTGAYCPGCGATRATNRLLRGDLAAAWSHHPGVVLLAVQVAVIGAVLTARRRDPRTLPRPLVLAWVTANALALIAIWLLRISAGDIPRGIF